VTRPSSNIFQGVESSVVHSSPSSTATFLPSSQRPQLESSTAPQTTASQGNPQQSSSPQSETTVSPLPAGAQCTADSQCKQPNVCLTGPQTTKCCETDIAGCPGSPCSDFNDCGSPYGCEVSIGKCCGYPPYTILSGSTCFSSS
jgi:hypothetical protein